ncbi:phage terminase small subunit [Vibrio sp. Vb0599]|uniref:phage terminase small subunit n=1 Tax=Vibrio sp. Vb0599 TaxID=3074628 RepID=UPI00296482BF|nr:phage terminase small subunit [Vibrio sp. Vb0599]MDW1940903.1 phage terminase small subunit [Vibrio sp. Vb0599]
MLSPLARQRQQAKQQRATATHSVVAVASQSLHVLLAELENDERALKGLARIDEKVEHKRSVLIPKYKPHVEEYLAKGENYRNPLLGKMVIWLFDTEDLETAIAWCDKAIEQGLKTGFKRDFAHFCADSTLAWAEKMAANGHSIEPYFSQVFEKVRTKWRLKEKPTAKWFKFAGIHLLRDSNGVPRPAAVGDLETLNQSLALLIEANNQYDKIGVGDKINRVRARISALTTGKNL